MSGWRLHGRLTAQPAVDGDGVAIRRIGGQPAVLDPFLLVDELQAETAADIGGGFPPHPHRGFETITLVRTGGFEHRDSQGHAGAVRDGGAQWMTAGSGLVHSEMPLADADRFHGFQLWLNLPAVDKLVAPAWRDLQLAEQGRYAWPGGAVQVVAGEVAVAGGEVAGPGGPDHVQRRTTPLVADLTLAGEPTDLTLLVPRVLLYVYRGAVEVAGQPPLHGGELLVLERTDDAPLKLQPLGPAGVLLLGGTPLHEPVVQHGPFVMNDRAGVEQAMADYRAGAMG